MKKLLFILISLLFINVLNACSKIKSSAIYTSYHLYSNVLNHDSYYEINTFEDLVTFNNMYSHISYFNSNYDQTFFKENSLFAFLITEGSGGNRFELTSNNELTNGTLTINYKCTNVGQTCDMAYWVILYHLPKEVAESVKKIDIVSVSTHYTTSLYNINEFVTKLPEESNNITLFVSWYDGNHFSYDSGSSKLSNTVNNKVTLTLSKEQLNEIYHILRNINFDKYQEFISLSNIGLYDVAVYLYSDDFNTSCTIYGIESFDISTWEYYQELGLVINKILNDYIYSTSEYQELLNMINK